MTRLSILALTLAAAVATGACRKDEQNRPTSFTPGVYKGEAMPTLTKEQVAELAKRGQLLK
jgi:hypothetical protein